MKKSQLLELIKRVVREEQDYQQLFKHMLDKVGKSITDMSDDEKKKFFNAVDTAYKAKSEGRLRGYNENVNEGKKTFKINPPIGSSKYSISFHDGNKKHGDGSDFYDIKIFKNKIDLEKAIKDFKSKGFIAMNEAELTDKQKQIDVDKDGEIEGSDLAALRAKNEGVKKKK